MGVPINFKNVKFQNLFSYGNNVTEIDLSEPKLHLIVGDSGAGKSTILDAICFGLFGKSYKKVTKSSIINSVNNKGTLVEICFSIGNDTFVVRRGLKPTIFEIHKNGEILDQDAKSLDMQKNLENNILGGIDYNTFMQTSIIGSANFVPFMQLTTSARREITEKIMSLSIFKYASDITKSRIKKKDTERNSIFSEFRLNSGILEEKLNTFKILTNKKNSDSSVIENEKKDIIDEITSLKDANLALTVQVTDIKAAVIDTLSKAPEREYLDELKSKGIEKSNLKEDLIEKIRLWDNGNCPTCGHALDKKDTSLFDYEGSVSLIKEIDEVLVSYRNEIVEGNKTLKFIEDKKKEGSVICSKMENIKDKISLREKNLNILESKKTESFDESLITGIKEQIQEIEKNITISKENLVEIDEKIKYLKLASNMFKDDGIKSNIIKVFIPLINKYMNEYLEIFELDIHFEFDENFNETIKGRGRDDYVYNNFSEGEKKRIDLAVLFSWLKIAEIKNSATINLLCCDEIMDGSLDSESVSNLVKILRKLISDSNKSIFVISHRSELKDAFFDKVYGVKKEGQFSYIEEIE